MFIDIVGENKMTVKQLIKEAIMKIVESLFTVVLGGLLLLGGYGIGETVAETRQAKADLNRTKTRIQKQYDKDHNFTYGCKVLITKGFYAGYCGIVNGQRGINQYKVYIFVKDNTTIFDYITKDEMINTEVK